MDNFYEGGCLEAVTKCGQTKSKLEEISPQCQCKTLIFCNKGNFERIILAKIFAYTLH